MKFLKNNNKLNNINLTNCSKCVLDSQTPKINLVLDENGVCNNCNKYDYFVSKNIVGLSYDDKERRLNQLVEKIKKAGKGKKYDCILGISGGMDSAYLALRAHELGLHPLVVHFDNGWNSELAVKNIYNIITKLNYDLHTYVINWEEFKDIQLSYFKASVIDIEVPTDQFIYATLYEIAYEKGIRYILDGNNIETEFWGGSWKWSYDKLDLENLQNIHKKFGSIKLTKYPKLGKFQRYFYNTIVGIESAYLLNYLPYNRAEVINTLENEFGWQDPGGKHYESIFTRFYQGYILPNKFGIDKRKAHLSNLIWSGQITRDEALVILEKPTYDINLQQIDKEYIIKKWNLSDVEFEEIMNLPVVSHEFYGTDEMIEKRFRLFVKLVETFPGRVVLFGLKKIKVIRSLY